MLCHRRLDTKERLYYINVNTHLLTHFWNTLTLSKNNLSALNPFYSSKVSKMVQQYQSVQQNVAEKSSKRRLSCFHM